MALGWGLEASGYPIRFCVRYGEDAADAAYGKATDAVTPLAAATEAGG